MAMPGHPTLHGKRLSHAGLLASVLGLAACAAPAGGPGHAGGNGSLRLDPLLFANRVTWGADSASVRQIEVDGAASYLEQQLRPGPAVLPAEVQAQIDAMTISRVPLPQLAAELAQQKMAADAAADDGARQAARQQLNQSLNTLAREAATRSLLRDLYSPRQLQEQMTWFWLNHFSVFQHKGPIRALLADYEDQLRAHALGRFRDLLGVTAHHPAMLHYLDNAQNAAGHINENYARELMELHTLGVDGGYSQRDVQELARVLTGVGIVHPAQLREQPAAAVREGLFEFNPRRHDNGEKTLLGQPLHAKGLAEVDEALDRLARHPATARFISRKLAQYFVGDEPPPRLVAAMADTFLRRDGQIADTLRTLFRSPEFAASLGRRFKDPMHYVVSAVRLAYDGKPILNAGPMLAWINRMGEPLYGHQTPDGYPLLSSAWASPGQMTTRFEIARAIGNGSAGLFRGEGLSPMARPAFPQLAGPLYYRHWQALISPATRQALDQAESPQEWNTFLLSSPDFMNR
ncbi:DUF1800 domain-containing protein [Chitinivorax sp. PXF-14]|uniref:DUF1800 domain-containing protein n=1 Tax=Chitinivorax sp. PXF-14 TaxID=3230488 RepID=UPI003466AD12